MAHGVMAALLLLGICGQGAYSGTVPGSGQAPEMLHLDPEGYRETFFHFRVQNPGTAEAYNETLRRYVRFSNLTRAWNLNSYRLVLAYYIEYTKGGESEAESEAIDNQSYKDVYSYDQNDRTEILNAHSQNFRENLYYKEGGPYPWSENPSDDDVAVIQSSGFGKAGGKAGAAGAAVNMAEVLKVQKEALSLDPKTANPILTISPDGTSVKPGTYQKLADNPERFDALPCVLASKPFASGKHYWEVQVLDQPCPVCTPGIWIVGVAKQTVKRKGKVYTTQDEGIWALQWVNILLGGISIPFDAMNAKTKPSSLGVYLDVEGGQLSFYNAVNGKLLYNIKDTFGEPVFPIFCGTNSVELKV
ncbi:uncharacterized protein [Ambystoma mexicanum]|uniref:uncharacterized protein n=1 Tax=Ambystoma mexicanum TaxID=8296 RepID=UPI0037E91C89